MPKSLGKNANKKKKGRREQVENETQTDGTDTTTHQLPSSLATGENERTCPSGYRLFVALYDYDARTAEELTFQKGDYLEVKPENIACEWWRARSRETKKEGYVPKNFVEEIKTLEAEDWYFGKISRDETEKLLKANINKHGSFLIRESNTIAGALALSLRNCEEVKHYTIKLSDKGGYFTWEHHEFNSLRNLVAFHLHDAEDLCCKLVQPCKTIDKWEIDKNELTFKRCLGAGDFGEVWEGLWKNTAKVAIKTLKEGRMLPSKFLEEAELIKKLNHPKLVQLFAVCSREEPIYIVTELMENGSLLDYLRGPKGKLLEVPKLIDMATQVAQGMAYLEKHGYVHRDLAARNVLVGKTLNVKIADFGLTRSVVEKPYAAPAGTKFPIKWTAPEACLTNIFSIKSDVWSFGVLVSELITYGETPYPGMSNREVIIKIKNENYRMPKPSNAPDKLYKDIMLKCWAKEPDDRPTFETLSWQLDEFFSDDTQDEEVENNCAPTTAEDVIVYVALYDYEAQREDQLSFKEGDYLEVKIEDCNFDWWMAKSRNTGNTGYIPNNYVAEVKSLDAEEWYFGNIDREETEEVLKADINKHGSFLIRESTTKANSLVLSLRHGKQVIHYKILKLYGGGYLMWKDREFYSLQDLVAFYHYSEGLCCKLMQPCKKTVGISCNMVNKLEIDRDALKFTRKLGAGNFGEVWQGVWNATTQVAIKCLRPGTVQREAFLKETEKMTKLNHPKFVQLYAVCSREEPIYIVTELMTKGSLLDYLHGEGRHTLNMFKMMEIAAHVAEGMAFLESRGLVHRDLAARNVLLGEGLNVKIADFGLSQVFKKHVYRAHEKERFLKKLIAPEGCFENKFSIKSDVWSFGILLTEIATFGDTPYPAMSNSEVIKKIADSNYKMPKQQQVPEKLYDIMLQCWSALPEDRPTFKALKSQLENILNDFKLKKRDAIEGRTTALNHDNLFTMKL